MKSFLFALTLGALVSLTACGGGTTSTGGTTPPPTTFTISASVSGLVTGASVVLQNNGGNNLTISANGTSAFSTAVSSGGAYAVTILTQPSGETCTVGSNSSGTATANVTVAITCSTSGGTLSISVAATGISGGTLVLQDAPSDQLTFSSDGTQTFATKYTSGGAYNVTVVSTPPGVSCVPSNNTSGTITANLTITVTCSTGTTSDTISVTTSGLTGTLVLQDDKADTLTFTGDITQTFATSYVNGSSYSVSVKTAPAGQTCALSSNASGTITSNITVTATCSTTSTNPTISVAVSGLISGGSVILTDDKGDTLTFNSNSTQTFATSYASGSAYAVNVSTQPSAQTCTPTYSSATINANVTINATCATGATRQLGTVSAVSSVACSGAIKNGVCQQMTIACPGVDPVQAFVKTNAPTGTSIGTVTFGTGTNGNGLYESIFTFGGTAIQDVLDGGYTAVQISWGLPFTSGQPSGWVEGPGGVLAAACRYATVTQWIYDNIQNNKAVPMCATANSGGAGALAYALSQYGSSNILSMAEVTSGPPTGRLDWGCGCQAGAMPVSCGATPTMGTCFGAVDSPVWDPAYSPSLSANPYCSNAAVNKVLPPGGTDYFLGDSVEAPGASYSFPKTFVNLVFGGQDISSAIPIGQDWFNKITSSPKGQVCVADAPHSIADVPDGAQQIATDLINNCKLQ